MTHYAKWKEWKRSNRNTKLYQVLVLLKVIVSPTFEMFVTSEELKAIKEGATNE